MIILLLFPSQYYMFSIFIFIIFTITNYNIIITILLIILYRKNFLSEKAISFTKITKIFIEITFLNTILLLYKKPKSQMWNKKNLITEKNCIKLLNCIKICKYKI